MNNLSNTCCCPRPISSSVAAVKSSERVVFLQEKKESHCERGGGIFFQMNLSKTFRPRVFWSRFHVVPNHLTSRNRHMWMVVGLNFHFFLPKTINSWGLIKIVVLQSDLVEIIIFIYRCQFSCFRKSLITAVMAFVNSHFFYFCLLLVALWGKLASSGILLDRNGCGKSKLCLFKPAGCGWSHLCIATFYSLQFQTPN